MHFSKLANLNRVMKTFRRLRLKAIFMFFLLGTLLPPAGPALADPRPLAFGTLPVLQALPIFVAQEMGLFKAEGLEVELAPFRTAMEKDMALSVGQLDGYFGDLFTPIIARAGGVDLRIVAQNFVTTPDQRMFAILAGPDTDLKVAVQLADQPVAVSTSTIIEYVTVTLLVEAGVPPHQIKFIEAKNIPLRFQMLMSGQVKAATLPEPLVTLAESQGAKVLADDSQSGLTSTVLVFSVATIKNRAQDIEKFLTGIKNANDVINSGSPQVREIMIRNCQVPKPLQDTYPIPKFPELVVPEQERIEAAVNFLEERGALKQRPEYSELVNDEFVK